MAWERMKAAALGACLLVAGCADLRGVKVASWQPEFRPPRVEATAGMPQPASATASAMGYYARRWSRTALGPAYGYKLLDPSAAAERPWGRNAQVEDVLKWMRRANAALAAQQGLSATVKTAPDASGLMPLAELRSTPEFRADPEAYLAWYRMGRYRVGPYVVGMSGAEAYLRAQARPDLAIEHQLGARRVVMGFTGAVLAVPLLVGGLSLLHTADGIAQDEAAKGPPYRIFPSEDEDRYRRTGIQIVVLGLFGAVAPLFVPGGYQRMDQAWAEFNAMLDGSAQ